MCNFNLPCLTLQVPSVLTSLQKSVHAMLLGRSQLPEWLSEGIRENSKTATIRLDMATPPDTGEEKGVSDSGSVASVCEQVAR